MLTGYSNNLPSDIVLDSGVLYAASTLIGATKGEPEFDPGFTVENFDFDGKQSDILGLDRRFNGASKVSATIFEFGPAASGAQLAKIEAGSTEATAGTTPNTITTVTPKTGGGLYASGDYLTDFRLIFERGITAGAGIKKYACIYMPKAIVMKWGPIKGANRAQATFSIEVVGRRDMSSGLVGDATYKIELRESLP